MTEAVAIDPVEEDLSPLPGSVEYPIYKQINLAQLESELKAALPKTAAFHTVLVGPDRYDAEIAEDNPLRLLVRPTSTDPDIIKQVIAAHQPENNWGVPAVLTEFDAVWSKVIANPETNLTAKEQKALLIGLAIKWHQQAVLAGPLQ